ncbi:MAG: zinc-ribbon domain-containing protein [Deltaproteobacteria bacterium]|nr:zinc-ribbon domain-containing protein [Deltaproteobacteria bacterium]
MNVSCPQCKTRYSVDDSRIPPSGVSIKCPKCTHTFVAKKDQGDGAVALPGNVAPKAPSRESSAVALPGNVAAKPKIPAATTDAGLDSDLDLGLDDDMPAPKKAAPPPKPKAPPPPSRPRASPNRASSTSSTTPGKRPGLAAEAAVDRSNTGCAAATGGSRVLLGSGGWSP